MSKFYNSVCPYRRFFFFFLNKNEVLFIANKETYNPASVETARGDYRYFGSSVILASALYAVVIMWPTVLCRL